MPQVSVSGNTFAETEPEKERHPYALLDGLPPKVEQTPERRGQYRLYAVAERSIDLDSSHPQ